VIKAVQEQLAAFREGAGPTWANQWWHLNFTTRRSFLKMARAWSLSTSPGWRSTRGTRPPGCTTFAAPSHARPLAGEPFGRRDYPPVFENYSWHVAIIDTPWNGWGSR